MLVVADADASPLRYLIALEKQKILPKIFEQIWVPSAVVDELTAASTQSSVRREIENHPRWLKVGEPQAEALNRINPELDLGERAALALALQLRADLVLVDDAAGRREASSLGLRITWTIGVLRLAAERQLVDVHETLAKLRSEGFYIRDSVIQEAFDSWLRK